jgi:dTDP-glucose 4,6-dehydratase
MARRMLVTGGAGFIGSALVRHLIAESDDEILVVDKLTYAGSRASLATVSEEPRFRFLQADIADEPAMRRAFASFDPGVVIHLAAESHVDRSIVGPRTFIDTNVVGTCVLLQVARDHWRALAGAHRDGFRFVQVSTDEVFGELGPDGRFDEDSPYRPNSPYSASKAAGDHLVLAFARTYGLPVTVTNGCNTYGPYQYPEKLVPRMVINALAGRALPVYGTGDNVRDWLHVDDHAKAVHRVVEDGAPGQRYTIGGGAERANIDVVRAICAVLDEIMPDKRNGAHERRIAFVEDRAGHDFRYAVDCARIRALGWRPLVAFEAGLRDTVRWYCDNRQWWQSEAAKPGVAAMAGQAAP